MSQEKDKNPSQEAEFFMNRRGDVRIELQLPCRLLFPNLWAGSVDGYTANLHRNGVLVACEMSAGRRLPAVGEVAKVHIELPARQDYPPKFITCHTTLLRVDPLGESRFHFALQIQNVDFADFTPAALELMKLDSESCTFIM